MDVRARGLFRVDASSKIGLGHLFRAFSLARELQRLGLECQFLMRSSEPLVKNLFQQKDDRNSPFKVEFLDASVSTWEHERTLICQMLSGFDFVFLDSRAWGTNESRHAPQNYLESLLSTDTSVFSIDGFFGLDLPYSLLFLPFVGASKFASQFSKARNLKLGPDYFIFSDAMVAAHQKSHSKVATVPTAPSRILASFGGSDPGGITEKFVQSFPSSHNYNIKCVLGPLFDENRKSELIERTSTQIEFLTDQANLADELLWADLAVISGGLTKYEAAACGTPAIAISQNSYEKTYTDEFALSGSIIHLGMVNDVTPELIFTNISQTLQRPDKLSQMAKLGKLIVGDCRGVQNSGRAILEHLSAR